MKTTFLDNYFYHNPNFNPIRRTNIKPQEVGVLAKKSAHESNVLHFEKVCEKNGSSYSIDRKTGLSRIDWRGHVDIHTAKKLIRIGFETIENGESNKLLIDHSSLVEFETEARVWVKEILKHKAETLNDKLSKLASVSPSMAIGSIFSNFASNILKTEMPHLSLKRFDEVDTALDWLS